MSEKFNKSEPRHVQILREERDQSQEDARRQRRAAIALRIDRTDLKEQLEAAHAKLKACDEFALSDRALAEARRKIEEMTLERDSLANLCQQSSKVIREFEDETTIQSLRKDLKWYHSERERLILELEDARKALRPAATPRLTATEARTTDLSALGTSRPDNIDIAWNCNFAIAQENVNEVESERLYALAKERRVKELEDELAEMTDYRLREFDIGRRFRDERDALRATLDATKADCARWEQRLGASRDEAGRLKAEVETARKELATTLQVRLDRTKTVVEGIIADRPETLIDAGWVPRVVALDTLAYYHLNHMHNTSAQLSHMVQTWLASRAQAKDAT